MTITTDLAGFALLLAKMPTTVLVQQHEAMELAARIVEDEAKAEIGNYQGATGPFPAWDPLAPDTVAEKTRLGYSPPDNPLLRTGDLRNSIEHTVAPLSLGDALAGASEAAVGSDSDVAVWQELGTSRMPARSFLGGAASRKSTEVAELLGHAVYAALVGPGTKTRIP